MVKGYDEWTTARRPFNSLWARFWLVGMRGLPRLSKTKTGVPKGFGFG
jgi:hypothetical protein